MSASFSMTPETLRLIDEARIKGQTFRSRSHKAEYLIRLALASR